MFEERYERIHRPSEHPRQSGGKMLKRLGGIKGCKYVVASIVMRFGGVYFIIYLAESAGFCIHVDCCLPYSR